VTVTVYDTLAPDVAQNIIAPLDESGHVSITPVHIDAGTFDVCGIEFMRLDVDTFDCSNAGTSQFRFWDEFDKMSITPMLYFFLRFQSISTKI
jgi:hypothetical protein